MDSIEDRARQAQRTIGRMSRRRAPFHAIESMINELDGFDDEQKSALWLYAWAKQPRRVLRAETTALLTLTTPR